MKLHELQLRNFRCFENFFLYFSPQVNVLHGINGSGKTTILDAIGVGLSRYLRQFSVDENELSTFSVSDAFQKPTFSDNLEAQYPVNVNLTLELNSVSYSLVEALIRHDMSRFVDSTFNESFLSKVTTLVQKMRKGEQETLPIFAYFGLDRAHSLKAQLDSPWAQRGSRDRAYKNALHPAENVDSLLGWIKTREAISLQVGQQEVQLQAVKQAIAANMERWTQIRYEFENDDLFFVSNDGQIVPMRLLSDGQRSVLAIVADLARRMAILNPHLKSEILSKTPGIVLIDEIDMHLHPQWQRRVVERLRQTFPLVQFIVTTHSPFIIQSARPGELIDLNGDGESAL